MKSGMVHENMESGMWNVLEADHELSEDFCCAEF